MSNNGVKHFNQHGLPIRERAPEAYKLFVGQVPKTWGEKELRPVFERYGEIFEISILKDKYTGQHKGCAFLTYYTKEAAEKAQKEMHNVERLPGMQNNVQVKPADSETKAEDRKLFVGMISKRASEEDMKLMFAPFGVIEDLSILRNGDGSSKACCFIKYENRLQAQNAIRAMHNNRTMEGCSSPIVVKLADTEKDKMQKRMHSVASNLVAMGLSLQMQQTGLQSPTPAAPGASANGFPITAQQHYYHQLFLQALANGIGTNPLTNILSPGAMTPPYIGMYPQQAESERQPQREGPEGANLFIYHLPQEFLDADLMQMFTPFGNVLSAKVFIDKITKFSKCFGFVSYDNPTSAQLAITTMNGFSIGAKKLKVQLRRPKDQNPNKPQQY